MILRKSIYILGITVFFSSCMEKSSNSGQTKQVSRELPEGIAGPKKVEIKPIWIDVRSPEEFKSGYLEGAINIPHTEIAEKLPETVPDKSATIHFYCRSGNRSGLALETAKKLGYTEISNKGAYKNLKK